MARTLTGDAVERLLDEQRQIDELLDTYARHRLDPGDRTLETARLAALIVTLLRVHCELEATLVGALGRALGSHPALDAAVQHSAAVGEAIEHVEAMSTRDPEYALEMGALARRVRRWFAADESGLFELARRSPLDLVALDRELAERQETLLAAGRVR
jgi:hypothetical protein